ncbi:hypothetical protein KRP22_013567 [Phytophthora ramorum]|nr:Protein argonaute-3 [Phytophthora ramorum]
MSTSVAKYQHSTFSKAIRDAKVNMTHRPGVKRSYRVNGLSRESADNTFFGDDEGQRMSIAQYFQQTYKIRLRYPKLSCLQRNYLPIEVCHAIAGQKCLRNVTDKQPRVVPTTGRQLPPPAIEYSGGARESSRDGAWNVHSKRLNTPAQFKSWAVISMCAPNRCGLGEIQKFFKAQMDQLGMGCPRTPC